VDRPFYPEFVIAVIPRLLAFLPVTLLIMGGTVVSGSLLGLLLAKARMGRNGVLRAFSSGYTLAMRCTPSIVLLFIRYYTLPELMQALFGVDINGVSRSFFVILALTLLFAANMGELMRSAYEAIDKGQREAALSTGLSEVQAFSGSPPPRPRRWPFPISATPSSP
jgi:L-cystine transport system permease protein